jgi:hypothetical protein
LDQTTIEQLTIQPIGIFSNESLVKITFEKQQLKHQNNIFQFFQNSEVKNIEKPV